MAMQAGFGLSRIVLIAGAGYTGTILLKNGKLSDVLAELQNLIKSGESEGDSDYSDAVATQVRRLAMEVRQLASSRQITVLNGNSSQSNLTSLVVPAAAVGALGYGYMWWKGLSFSDLMYVTKQNMANAVSNLSKHLDHVSDALAAAKKHLTQRIENLDGKIDEQIEISKLIRTEVNDVRDDLGQIGGNLEELQRMVSGLDGKLFSLEEKQEIANAGVLYLCAIVNGKKETMPIAFQEQLKLTGNSTPNLMGLKGIVGSPGSNLLTYGNAQDSSDKLNKTLTRTVSNKC
ncbi:GRIP/coiled-coil protein [Perilla frutescens var. hirtella]|uniref:GRIP/coiled-coil protein n=1 Tax=Perilla frutescens var. hirtella TaxID=608512 RepID=A0AAD4JD90_PERFH|nr:GRIP/coiled-coil protein [Perilla frutescens var. frutescens]KAH6792531.1 GRIP/coiled-coil protein [Perilla frutescens var. hirtella]KAH6830970.1 GRIP/coiled-coil protein [Perilla frutescens var. hirtella]